MNGDEDVLFVIHSGQTGVERGAHDAAIAAGVGIAGFMPADGRDELGPLSSGVSRCLTPYPGRGQRPAIKANIDIASAALVVVPDADLADEFPAMLWILQAIRGRGIPLLRCDPSSDLSTVEAWSSHIRPTAGSVRLFVTGPRDTRWTGGRRAARRIVQAVTHAFPAQMTSLVS